MKKMSVARVMGLALAGFVSIAAEAAVKVAVLPSSKNQHGDEYNPQLTAMGAKFDLYKDEPDATKNMVAKIDDYAVVMTPPLHGYMKGGHKGNHETLEKYAGIVKAWIEKGGFLYVGDANYGETLTWLKAIDPSLGIETQLCGQSGGPAKMVAPEDPILLAPNRVDPWWWWAHMSLPDPKNTGWRVAAVCNHDHPTILTKRIGKGMIYVTSLRGKEDQLIQNFFVQRMLSDVGLEVIRTEVPDIHPGKNTVKAFVRGIGSTDVDTKVVFTIGKETFSANAIVKPGEEKEISIDCVVNGRGKLRAEVRVVSGSADASCYGREFYIPEFFDIKGTCYRGGILVRERRFDDVKIVTTFYPVDEKSEDYVVNVKAYSKKGGKGRLLGSGTKQVVRGIDTVNMTLPKDLPAGEFWVKGEFVKIADGEVVFEKEFPVTILEQEPGTVVADDDGTFLVEGEPYYPLGLYHSDADLKKYQNVGCNLYHSMKWGATSWYCKNPLSYESGHMMFWEEYAKSDKALDGLTEFWRNTPSLFSYYLSDEPKEREYENVLNYYKRFIARDNRHPTFVCACYPDTWARFAWACDIMAANPYPYWPQFKRDTVGCNWVPVRDASGGTRSVLAVPQAFGHEGEAPLRCMSLTAVANGVNGICWYAWQNDPWKKEGARFYDDTSIAYLTDLVADIKTITPALVNASPRMQVFQKKNSDGTNLSWCLATMPGTNAKILVAASQSPNPVEERIVGAGMGIKASTLGTVGKAFGELKVDGNDLVMKFGKFGSAIWYFGGEAPVMAKKPADFIRTDLPARASGKVVKVAKAGDLQSAIDNAKDGDVIEVAEGTYGPIVCANKLLDIVAVGSREKTIVRSSGEKRAAVLSVKDFGSMAAETNVLMRGFTFVGTGSSEGKLPKRGGCVFGGTIENCVFENGRAVYGGAMAYGVAKDCMFRKNKARFNGGAAVFIEAKNCVFVENEALFDGGALEFSRAWLCTFEKNKANRNGGAINFGDATSCKVFGNECGRDGGAGKATNFRNCLIVGNMAGGKGGAVMGGNFEFCTVLKNVAGDIGGAACGYDSFGKNISPTQIRGSVVWDNVSKGDKNKTRSFAETGDVEFSVVEPMADVKYKDNVITVKPNLTKDYRLAEGSVGIEVDHKAKFNKAEGKELDPDGNARLSGKFADYGCYESMN